MIDVKVKQLINNLNWFRRDSEYKHIEKNYRQVTDLPRETRNTISIEAFEIQQIEHNEKVNAFVDRYGGNWRRSLLRYTFYI